MSGSPPASNPGSGNTCPAASVTTSPAATASVTTSPAATASVTISPAGTTPVTTSPEATASVTISPAGTTPVTTSSSVSTRKNLDNELRRVVTLLYRDLHTRTYCVPPFIMNRVPYDRDEVAGQPVLVTRPLPGYVTSGSPPFLSHPGQITNTTGQQEDPTAPRERSVQQLAGWLFRPVRQLSGWLFGSAQNLAGWLFGSARPLTGWLFGSTQRTPQESAQQTRQHRPRATPSHSSTHSLWPKEQHPLAQPVNVQESDSRDDFAQQHVLSCLQMLGESRQEAMCVMSSLDFTHYLNKLDAAHAAQFPLPGDLPSTQREGEFDVIVIHRKYGVLLGEIKSVGLHNNNPTDKAVVDKVTKAVNQLDKCEKVVNHVMSDVAPGVSVRKTLILPYISRARLQQVLDGNSQLAQRVCECVGAPDVKAAVALCMCSDDMSDRATPWLVDAAVLEKLDSWWTQRMACGTDATMSRYLYETLFSRFVGPATTVRVHCVIPPRVEVRTQGEGVSELGRRLALLVLTPEQLHLLTRSPANVCLNGPPGTGKTVVLILKGLNGARQGHPVVVLGLHPDSLASSRLIYQQLVMTLQEDPTTKQAAANVHFMYYQLLNRPENLEAALQELQSLVPTTPGQQLHVLIDEINFIYENLGTSTLRLVEKLLATYGPHISIWAACMFNNKIPKELQAEPLTVPLRSCPAVVREVELGLNRVGNIHNYSNSDTPFPSDGPRVIRIGHQGGHHTGRWPVECWACGVTVGGVLKEVLHVGLTDASTNLTGVGTTTSPPRLQYRDVLVLTSPHGLRETSNDRDPLTSQACGVVRGLRFAGLPVRVIESWKYDMTKWEHGVYDLTEADNADMVTVTFGETVSGLERPVVVWLSRGMSEDELDGRLNMISRCTTQLVIVSVLRNENACKLL